MEISKNLRKYFLKGLAVLLPTILTIWIIVLAYNFIQRYIGKWINLGLVYLIDNIPFLLPTWSTEQLTKFWVRGAGSIAGFIIALAIVLAVGTLLASVVGRTLWRAVEKFIMNTPFLRQIYPYVKQITDFVLTPEEKKKMFSRVVAVEYPRKGIWSMGLVTGSGVKKVVDTVQKEFLTVLIPTSPTPFTGFVIMVPKDETLDINITIEEALRFTVSGGVITPRRHAPFTREPETEIPTHREIPGQSPE